MKKTVRLRMQRQSIVWNVLKRMIHLKMNMKHTIRRLVGRYYITLMFAYESVLKYEIGAGHKRQYRINQYETHFSLEQFRQLNEQFPVVDYPLTVDNRVPSIQLPFYIFLLMFSKSLLVLFVPIVVRTVQRRAWLGTEMLGSARVYMETTLLLWSNIGVVYMKIGLSKWTADYKFLSIFAIDPDGPEWLLPKRYGLSRLNHMKYSKFLSFARKLYHFIIGSVSPTASFAVLFLFIRADLFSRQFLPSTLVWLCIYSAWIPCICVVIYGNIIIFIVVIRFLQIKSNYLIRYVKSRHRYSRSEEMYRSLLKWNNQAIEIYAEVDEYNTFWSKFLTVVLLNIVMLISQFIYIIFLSTARMFFRMVYAWVLLVHLFLLALLVYNCGSVFDGRYRLSKQFLARLYRIHSKNIIIKFRDYLKIHNHICELDSKERGFSLITDYVIRYDTFRVIICNVAIYFLLILNSSKSGRPP